MAWKEPYKTGKGEQRYRVVTRDALGKKTSKTFVRSRDADAYMLELTRKEQLGHLWTDAPITFGEFAGIVVNSRNYVRLTGTGWFERWGRTVRPSTFDRRKDVIRHLRELLPVPLDRITPALVQDVVLAVQKDHPRQARILHDTIKMILRAADVRGQAVQPGVLSLKPPAGGPARPRKALGDDEIDDLAQASTEPHLIRVAAYTGLRQGELFALRDEDIDLVAGLIHVRGTVYKAVRTDLTKTASGYRTVNVAPQVVTELKKQLLKRRGTRAVFPAPRGGLWFTSEFAPKFKGWATAAGLDITFHDLRHTFASLMVRTGCHPKELQELMGHKTFSITMELYSHLDDGQRKAAVDRLGEMLAGG